MSETRRNRDAAARASREAIERGETIAQEAAEEFRDMGESVADLLRCKSPEQFAEVQRNLYLGAVNRAVETLLQLAVQTAQQAMRPLPARTADGTRP